MATTGAVNKERWKETSSSSDNAEKGGNERKCPKQERKRGNQTQEFIEENSESGRQTAREEVGRPPSELYLDMYERGALQ